MAEPAHSIVLQYKGETYQFSIPSNWTIIQLHEFLEEQINVPKSNQKLYVKAGSAAGSHPIVFGDEHTQRMVSDIIPSHAKVLLVGHSAKETEDAQKLKGDALLLGFDEEARRARIRQRYTLEEEASNTYLQPRFGGVDCLKQFSSPPPSHALALLRRLANDPGIKGIMDKHNYRVGLLNEMPPEGLVGVDEVCVLGYNKNKGESITLRLRTDDLKGFRKYLVIRDTLIHELCHNEFSEHDSRFWELFYRLKREIVEYDRSAVGQAVGGKRASDMAHFDYEEDDGASLMDVDSSGHVLDPHHQHHHGHDHSQVSAAEMARLAAERRLAELPKLSPAVPSTTASSVPQTIPPSKPTTVDSPAVPVASSSTEDDDMDVVTNDAEATEQLNTPPPNHWRCPTCTYDNTFEANICVLCGTVSPSYAAALAAVPPELGEAQVIADPQVELSAKIQRSLDDFLRPLTANDRAAALTTLEKIYSNILSHPTETKYRSVSMLSRTFLNNIGRHHGALDHLQVVGFAPDPSNKDSLKLIRDDLVRLYLAASAVKEKLSKPM